MLVNVNVYKKIVAKVWQTLYEFNPHKLSYLPVKSGLDLCSINPRLSENVFELDQQSATSA